MVYGRRRREDRGADAERKKITMTPRQAKTFNQICTLQADKTETQNSWLMLEEDVVYLTNQKSGEPPTGEVEISRKDFEKFIAWYDRDQKPLKRKVGQR